MTGKRHMRGALIEKRRDSFFKQAVEETSELYFHS